MDEQPWHSRAIWWCWIVNDPFYAAWWSKEKGVQITAVQYFYCPLCEMKATTANPNEDEIFLAYHRFAGCVTNPFEGQRPVI